MSEGGERDRVEPRCVSEQCWEGGLGGVGRTCIPCGLSHYDFKCESDAGRWVFEMQLWCQCGEMPEPTRAGPQNLGESSQNRLEDK